MLKKILLYLICLLPYFLNRLFKIDYNYIKTIKTPFFTPPNIFYAISWTIIYILLAFTIYKLITNYKLKEIPISYKIILLINYILNQSYTLIFFKLKNNFLSFIVCLLTLITTLYLYNQISLLIKKYKYLIIPYILLSLFATILSLSIYLLNA